MDTETQERITNPFHAIARYASLHDVRSIQDFPGCWEVQVDEAWWFAVNGQRTPQPDSRGVLIHPFEAHVTYHGWPAAILRPDGEGVFAAGEGANVDSFIAALLGPQEGGRE